MKKNFQKKRKKSKKKFGRIKKLLTFALRLKITKTKLEKRSLKDGNNRNKKRKFFKQVILAKFNY